MAENDASNAKVTIDEIIAAIKKNPPCGVVLSHGDLESLRPSDNPIGDAVTYLVACGLSDDEAFEYLEEIGIIRSTS